MLAAAIFEEYRAGRLTAEEYWAALRAIVTGSK
jgi:hypothetical protein